MLLFNYESGRNENYNFIWETMPESLLTPWQSKNWFSRFIITVRIFPLQTEHRIKGSGV
jgi:hypothetical protein